MPYVCDLISWEGPNDKARRYPEGDHELYGPFQTKTAATQFGRENVRDVYDGMARYVVREIRTVDKKVHAPLILSDMLDEHPDGYLPNCLQCGKEIYADRVYSARSRGKDAKYCSDKCQRSATTKAYRRRKASK